MTDRSMSRGLPLLALVGVGGAVGATARVALSEAVGRAPDSFPWATFWANVVGAFLLGLVVVVLVERRPPALRIRALVGTGALGAFTTFSTFAVEADLLVRAGKAEMAAAYVVATVAVGLAAATTGARLGQTLGRRAGR